MARGRTGGRGASLASRGADIVLVTVRELRLLLGLLLILFVTAETWRYVGRLTVPRLLVGVGIGLVAALLVALVGTRRALRDGPDRIDVGRAAALVAGEVVAFGGAVFALLVLVGVATMDAGLVAEWTGAEGGVLASLGIGHPPLVVTGPLLQVAAALAALGALAFAVEAVSDPATRAALLRGLDEPAEPGRRPHGRST